MRRGSIHRSAADHCTDKLAWGLHKSPQRASSVQHSEQIGADHKPIEELYDLETDPHEVVNLAAQPEHTARLRSMRSDLDKWIIETGDRGAIMEDPVVVYNDFFKAAPAAK